jgi:DNA-binding CsgD family transcriptional regulator
MTEGRFPWEAAGLEKESGLVLEFLVTRPESSPADIAAALELPARSVVRALRALSDELLAVQVDRSPSRWSASPPRPAIHALLSRRRLALAEIEVLSERLQEAYNSSASQRFASDQFEILDTPGQVTGRYTHLLRAARSEVLHLAMPPYVADSSEVPDRLDAQATVIRKGVRFRSVYDADTFDDALSLMTARRGDEIGGEIRLSSGLPMKLVMFDATAAIMPLRSDDPAAGSLLVHSPTLLYVLSILFEELWEHGVPWKSDGMGSAVPAEPTEPAPDARGMQVLRLLSLGMKDDVIARVLGVSRRTVQQDISDISILLGARTRFQIAIFAQQRGWLPEAAGRKEPQPSRLSPAQARASPVSCPSLGRRAYGGGIRGTGHRPAGDGGFWCARRMMVRPGMARGREGVVGLPWTDRWLASGQGAGRILACLADQAAATECRGARDHDSQRCHLPS